MTERTLSRARAGDERALTEHALRSPDMLRLMTVPGVEVITAATFMALVGDITRFPSPRHLVGYVGLDPRVRQSGNGPARHGHIFKEGASAGRHVLCEAAWTATRSPGPLRAFAQRVQGRRGKNIAMVAVARKLCVIFWHLLTKSEDYAFARPSLTAQKLRRLELRVGAESQAGRAGAARAYRNKELRDQERELTVQAERAYQRLVADWQQSRPKGAGAAPGRASSSSQGAAARRASAPGPAL